MWWRIMFALMMCKSYFDCCWWSASPRFRRPRFRTRLLASPRKPAEACRDSIQRHRRRSTVWCSRAMWTMLYLYHPATRACHIWFHHKPTVACFSVCFPRRKNKKKETWKHRTSFRVTSAGNRNNADVVAIHKTFNANNNDGKVFDKNFPVELFKVNKKRRRKTWKSF